MKITVIGAGNGAFASAADLADRGHKVTMFNRTQSKLDTVRRSGGISLTFNNETRFVKPINVSSSPKEAITDADAIVVAVPTTAHAYVADRIGKCLSDGQLVLLNPGHTLGGLEFRNRLRRNSIKKKIKLCETMTLTYITRLRGAGAVQIFRKSKNIRISALPSVDNSSIFDTAKEIFPNLVLARNVLETGLDNINAICHPPGTIMNAGWIEHTRGNFKFYKDGITPGIGKITEAIDQERQAIMRSFAIKPISFVELFHSVGSTRLRKGSVYSAMKASEANKTIKAPASLDSRYILEDVGYGLVPMVELSKIAGVGAPTMESLVNLSSIMNGVNYWKEGRTAKKLGINGMKKADLLKLVGTGK